MIEVIIAVSVVALIVGFFLYASKSGAKLLKEREERMSRSSRGRAKILSGSPAGISGTGSGGRYQGYNFKLEVNDGYQSPYKTEVIWEVYPMGTPKVQTGMEIDVRIDSEDKMIVYPTADGVAFSWNGLMTLMAKKMK
jgi:hypothetical protein